MKQRNITTLTINVQDALTYKDAARELGVSTQTLWRWARDGKLATVKLGRYRLIPKSEIARFKEAKDEKESA